MRSKAFGTSKVGLGYTAFEIQVLTTSAIKCRGKFRIFQFASAMRWQKKKKTAKDLTETSVYHVGSGYGIPRHFAKDYDLVFNS